MISQTGHVRLVTNDARGNAPGDFACVRIDVHLTDGFSTAVVDDGWRLVGTSYVTHAPHDYVDLVYRFGGVP